MGHSESAQRTTPSEPAPTSMSRRQRFASLVIILMALAAWRVADSLSSRSSRDGVSEEAPSPTAQAVDEEVLGTQWREAAAEENLTEDLGDILAWLEEAPGSETFRIRATLDIPFGETRVAAGRENADGSLSFTLVTPSRAEAEADTELIRITTQEIRLQPEGELDTLSNPIVLMRAGQAATIEMNTDAHHGRIDLEPSLLDDGSGVRLDFQISESSETRDLP